MVLVRLLGSIGAGGVLYLTPLVFHRAFSASAVTEGLALAALAGTLGRFASGALLDRGCPSSRPVLLAVASASLGDLQLLLAGSVPAYALGQLLLGLAMGLYWPAIELAVSLTAAPGDSPRGYALARTADAAGIAAGALLGALLAALGMIRGIYAVDLLCLAGMAAVLWRRPLPQAAGSATGASPQPAQRLGSWLKPLLPILLVSVVATAVPALMQSALPLDLVRGGLARAPMAEGSGALLVGAQLLLLLLLQWPVGRWLADRPVQRGLRLSLQAFVLGAVLLALSALSRAASVPLVLLAQLPLALGLAAFLPTATEAVVELSPMASRGLAMALFSQCFALSALVAPLLAGRLLDAHDHGVGVWGLLALACLLALPLVDAIERHQRRSLLAVLSGAERAEPGAAAGPEILYRVGPPQAGSDRS
ncbi:MAG: MFS transporter [Cyanobacteriota bacterium]|nr:MFS transporter [Cyanobacteriota bacterium]